MKHNRPSWPLIATICVLILQLCALTSALLGVKHALQDAPRPIHLTIWVQPGRESEGAETARRLVERVEGLPGFSDGRHLQDVRTYGALK